MPPLLTSLQAGLAYFGDESTSASPDAQCADASRLTTAGGPLREALVSCFREIGNRIQFEGHEMTRVAALPAVAVARARRVGANSSFWPCGRCGKRSMVTMARRARIAASLCRPRQRLPPTAPASMRGRPRSVGVRRSWNQPWSRFWRRGEQRQWLGTGGAVGLPSCATRPRATP